MVEEPLSRRRVLAAAGRTGAAGGIVAAAGCSRLPGIGGVSGPTERWVAAPGAVPGDPDGSFWYMEPDSLLEQESHVDDPLVETLAETNHQHVDVDTTTLSTVVTYSWAEVWRGGFDESDVEGQLADAGYEEAGDHRGYGLWTADAEFPYADGAAVDGDTVVFADDPGGAVDAASALATAVDVGTGDATRFADANDAVGTLMDELGTTHVTHGNTDPLAIPAAESADPGRLDGVAASGFAWTVDGAESTWREVYVHEEAAAADGEAVRAHVDRRTDEGSSWGSAGDVTVDADGAVVTAEWTAPSDAFRFVWY